MTDVMAMLAETRRVLKEIPDWREGLKSLGTLARTNQAYREEHHDIKHEDKIWAILLSPKFKADITKDFKKVQEWTLTFLRVTLGHRGANVLWIDLGDAPELFEGRCFRTDPDNIEFDPNEAGAEVHDFPHKLRHTVFELSCPFWEEVADSDLYLPWLGFCALAVREALMRPKAREGLKPRNRIYITAGFEEPGEYIGTLTRDGYSFEPELAARTPSEPEKQADSDAAAGHENGDEPPDDSAED